MGSRDEVTVSEAKSREGQWHKAMATRPRRIRHGKLGHAYEDLRHRLGGGISCPQWENRCHPSALFPNGERPFETGAWTWPRRQPLS
jgi:hypothetical protein